MHNFADYWRSDFVLSQPGIMKVMSQKWSAAVWPALVPAHVTQGMIYYAKLG